MKERLSMRMILVVALLAGFNGIAWADTLFSEDFESGLTGWDFSSDVSTSAASPGDGDSAFIGDTGSLGLNYLDRAIHLGPGTYTLEFDFLAGISSATPQYFGVDSAFVGFRYVDSIVGYDFWTSSFDDSLSLYYSEPATSTEDINGGTVTPNTTIGGGWQHYSISFTSSYQYSVLAFIVDGANGIDNDSYLRVDNIQILGDASTAIPEPSTALMFGMGAIGCWLMSRRQRRALQS